MKLTTVKKTMAFTAAIVGSIALGGTQALASHHFDTTLVQQKPALNQLDNYVFASERPDHTVFIMNVSSTPKDGEDGVFSSEALYNIHVSNDDKFETGHTFSLQFEGDKYTLYSSDTPNGPVGEVGSKVGEGVVGEKAELSDGIQVWAGVVKDPFYGNSPSLHLLRSQLNSGQPYDPAIWSQSGGKSIFVGRKSAAIVLDVPNSMLSSTVRAFMTTDLKQNDDSWQQIQYSANPLFAHIMLFESEGLKEAYDHSRPDKQDEFKPIVAARISRAATLAKSQDDPIKYGNEIADQLVPDVLTYKPGTKATYSAAERNGRPLDDDAMSVVLTMLLGTDTDQKIPNPKLHTDTFPYVIPTTVN